MVYYRVEHETTYDYESTVATSQHVAYLRPRDLSRQRVATSDLAVEPLPARSTQRLDYFGNSVDQFTILKPHAELRVVARSLVEVRLPVAAPDLLASTPWEEVKAAIIYLKDQPNAPAGEYAYSSPYVAPDRELLAYARASFEPRRPILAAAADLMRRIHADFEFDPEATTLTTPVSKVLAERRGVCQDFAHLQIACLRALGLPARYVSGYLLTDPPPGQPRLLGADASHAWLAVWCPVLGWIDLDPTNDVLPTERHVTLGWGRDYGDVSPLRGVLLGGAEHTLRVGVSVIPLDEATWHEETAPPADN